MAHALRKLAEGAGGLPGLSVRRPYLVVVLNLLIIIAGIGAILGVEVRELPDVDRPIVSIRANYPGGSPETIDAEVTSVIEAAVARVNGVKSVRSSSEENNFRIHVEFSPSVNLIDAANDVREAVSRVERGLPEGVEDIVVIKADNDASSIVNLAVWSEQLQIDALTRLAEDQIIPELTSVDGVADVRIFGDRERVLRVLLHPMQLATHRVSVADVANVLRNARYDVPAGSFRSDEQEVLVRANASVIDPRKIESLIVRDPVRIGDVADVFFSPADAESYVRLNGRTVLNLGIVRQASSNTVSISNAVAGVVKRLQTQFPAVNIETISDDALFIKGSIREVLISLCFTVVIVVSVVALFIGQWRLAFIPAVAIPVALIGSIAAVWMLGFSINLITLLAMVLATGIVVDDAIVVLENIQRLRAQGLAARAAAVIGARQVFFAIIATTATLIAVFVPISFLPSTAGRLFQEFGFVLAVTVAISSFVALTICPVLVSRVADKAGAGAGRRRSLLAALGTGLVKLYTRPLDWAINAPLAVLGLCAIVAAGGAIVYQTLGEELVPEEDRGVINVRLVGPDGTGLAYTDRQVEAVEAVFAPLVADGTVERLFTITGRYDPNRGGVTAPLRPWSQRQRTEGEIAATLNPQLQQIPGAQVRIRRANSLNLRNADGGLFFALTGADYGRIAKASDAMVLAIERDVPQLQNLRVEYRATQPELSITIDRRRATDLGVSLEDLATTVQVLADQHEIAELTVDDQAVPIIVQAADGAVNQPSDLSNLYVNAAGDRLVPLSQLVNFSENSVAAELDRHGQRRAIEIRADVTGGMTLRGAVEAVRGVAHRTLSDGVGLMFLGEARALNETSHEITITYFIAFLVVFLVLVAQFESLTSALVVVLTVPFGLCAAVFALALTGTTINIYSQIGVLMLIGIMAKNAILMVEFADQLRDAGRSVAEAAREASLVRLRPIVMTMMSTVFAGLPLILSTGPGSEARSAIGWVIFGGLGLSALFTLFLAPAFYRLIAGLSKPRSHAGERLDSELAEATGEAPAE